MKKLIPLAAFAAVSLSAQQAPPTLPQMAKRAFDTTNGYIARAAEKMPEEQYGFKPSPDVRSFAGMVAHVLETNYGACARLKGEKDNPKKGMEANPPAKAAIVEAAKGLGAYCAPIFEGLEVTTMFEPAPGRSSPKLGTVYGLVGHNWEHYGNLVTYMRIKGVVPPSSEPRN